MALDERGRQRACAAEALGERTGHDVDEQRHAAGLCMDEVDDRRSRLLAQHAGDPRTDGIARQRSEHDGQAATGDGRAQRGQACPARSRPVRDDEPCPGNRGEIDQPAQGCGREPMGVVDEDRTAVRAGLGTGRPVGPGDGLQQSGLARPAGTADSRDEHGLRSGGDPLEKAARAGDACGPGCVGKLVHR